MIYVKMIGRLGNQLFYYSVARAIQAKYPNYGEIAVIPDDNVYDHWGGTQLLEFNVNVNEIVDKPDLSMAQLLIEKGFKMSRKIGSISQKSNFYKFTYKCQPALNRFGIYCMVGSNNIPLHYNTQLENIYISGVWENPYYFNDIRHILSQEITPKKEILSHNRDLFERIQNSNSVCISIRKGDFLKAGNEKFNICSENYYYKAVSAIKNKIGVFSLFIFSDDIEWCKKNLHFDNNVYYENNNGMDPVWEKIRLMSACKHFIISNSSFSWWAQYLGQFKNKIVVAPRPWRKNEYCDCLYSDDFILLDGKTGQLIER